MGSAQAILNVPASHMAGQQHAKHYLRVPRQSASGRWSPQGFGNKHDNDKEVQMWKQSSYSLNRVVLTIHVIHVNYNPCNLTLLVWKNMFASHISNNFLRSWHTLTKRPGVIYYILEFLFWNKLGLIYLSHTHAILYIAINSHRVTLQCSIPSVSSYLSVSCQNSASEFYWREKVSKKDRESTIVFVDFDSFQLALILSLMGLGHLEGNTKAAKTANSSSKPNNTGFCIR